VPDSRTRFNFPTGLKTALMRRAQRYSGTTRLVQPKPERPPAAGAASTPSRAVRICAMTLTRASHKLLTTCRR
jgi:hypothetical protein